MAIFIKTLSLLCILYSCNLTHDSVNQGVVINLSEIRVGSFRPLIGVSDDTVAGFIDAGVFCKSKKELLKSGKITAHKLEELSSESNSIVAIAKLK